MTYLGHLRVFRCVVYTHVAKERRGKLDETAGRVLFVGYTPTTRLNRVFDLQKRITELHTSVRLDENKRGGDLMPTPAGVKSRRWTSRDSYKEEIGNTIVVQPRAPQPEQEPEQEQEQEQEPEQEPEPVRIPETTECQTRSGRIRYHAR